MTFNISFQDNCFSFFEQDIFNSGSTFELPKLITHTNLINRIWAWVIRLFDGMEIEINQQLYTIRKTELKNFIKKFEQETNLTKKFPNDEWIDTIIESFNKNKTQSIIKFDELIESVCGELLNNKNSLKLYEIELNKASSSIKKLDNQLATNIEIKESEEVFSLVNLPNIEEQLEFVQFCQNEIEFMKSRANGILLQELKALGVLDQSSPYILTDQQKLEGFREKIIRVKEKIEIFDQLLAEGLRDFIFMEKFMDITQGHFTTMMDPNNGLNRIEKECEQTIRDLEENIVTEDFGVTDKTFFVEDPNCDYRNIPNWNPAFFYIINHFKKHIEKLVVNTTLSDHSQAGDTNKHVNEEIVKCINSNFFYNYFAMCQQVLSGADLLSTSPNDISDAIKIWEKEKKGMSLFFSEEVIDYIESQKIYEESFQQEYCHLIRNNCYSLIFLIKKLKPEISDEEIDKLIQAGILSETYVKLKGVTRFSKSKRANY